MNDFSDHDRSTSFFEALRRARENMHDNQVNSEKESGEKWVQTNKRAGEMKNGNKAADPEEPDPQLIARVREILPDRQFEIDRLVDSIKESPAAGWTITITFRDAQHEPAVTVQRISSKVTLQEQARFVPQTWRPASHPGGLDAHNPYRHLFDGDEPDRGRFDFYCLETAEDNSNRRITKKVAIAVREAMDRNGRATLYAYGKSMFPYIQQGDLCTFLARDADLLERGDIALYQLATGMLVAHRFLGRIQDSYGLKAYLFKGDSNLTADPPVHAGQIIGKMTRIDPAKRPFRLSHLFRKTWCRLHYSGVQIRSI
ncbi:hypothetical protein EWI07_03835 [Sporolactobacillus sp. THM7-4]|nr:hypothetical protein EWI07_03835 [Sporolactobacillus sp. THM7-4]